MIRLLLTCLCVYHVSAQGRLRKISGDAAPEKAQEPIETEELDDTIHTIDSSVLFGSFLPEPPTLISPPSEKPRHHLTTSPSAPPSVRPHSTMMPRSSQSDSDSDTGTGTDNQNHNRTTVTTRMPYDDVQTTASLEDSEEFQKADILEKEREDEVKDLVRKNKTNDFYITSSTTTMPSELETDTIGEMGKEKEEDTDDVFEFDRLFDKKMIKNEQRANIIMENKTTTFSTTTTNKPNTTTTTSTSDQKKTCIKLDSLKKVDREAPGTRKGTIQVSVDVGEDDSSEEIEEEKPKSARDGKKRHAVWKKYEMNCDEEEDEKGNVCKVC
uniref:Uncharacterized protein n=1 Tax=Caenorhabditis japonica TaxID=281687 RepID=A0A8R1HV12_CAEJA